MLQKCLPTLLIKNAEYVVTVNAKGQVLRRASILVQGNQIAEVNTKKKTADQVIDASGMVALPGFINCHHHMSQAFLRHVPQMQNQRIDRWIALVCDLTQKMDAEAHYWAALVNMAELLLSGCTTTTDMLYLFPKKYQSLELFAASIKAAEDLGMRFHPFRGSMSLSRKDGALFADEVVETPEEISLRTVEAVERFHDPGEDSMCRVGIAPCTIFTSTPQDYQTATALAEKHDLNLQTHLSESAYEQEYSQERFQKTPLEYLQSLGWVDERVSIVHGIELDPKDITRLKKSKSSLCHCPISNARSPIGQQGIAPVWECMHEGINVAIGVDGSAGNDSSNILEEMRWARTIQGARRDATYLQPLAVLSMATLGGAKALRWDQAIGSLEPGKKADMAIFNLNDSIGHVGAWDLVGSLISCQAKRVHTLLVDGKVVVRDGELLPMSESKIIEKARKKWRQIFKD